jgi:hypothetical protein
VNVRFDMSIAESSRSGVGPPKSRLLGAHVGRPRSLLTFPKADITSFGSADQYGWIRTFSDRDAMARMRKNRTFRGLAF